MQQRLRLVQYNVRRFTADDSSSSVGAIAQALASLSPDIVTLNEVDLHHRPGALDTVCAALAQDAGRPFTSRFFGHAFNGFYGNAVLSVAAQGGAQDGGSGSGSSTKVNLEGGSEVPHKNGTYRIHRGLLVCDVRVPPVLGLPHDTLAVAVTHLDHIAETQRRTQMDHVLRVLREQGCAAEPASERGTAIAAGATGVVGAQGEAESSGGGDGAGVPKQQQQRPCVLLGDLNALNKVRIHPNVI